MKLQATKILDIDGDYWSFRCQNWFSAGWDNWDTERNGPLQLDPKKPEEVSENIDAKIESNDEPPAEEVGVEDFVDSVIEETEVEPKVEEKEAPAESG